LLCGFSASLSEFLADRTNGRAYAAVLLTLPSLICMELMYCGKTVRSRA